jgi:hypothetical protein
MQWIALTGISLPYRSQSMSLFRGFIPAALLGSATLLITAPARAVVYCNTVGLPQGCVVRRPVAAPGAAVVGPVVNPVVNPSPGVGYGAPGVGVRPAAGPGVGPNLGGPVNRRGLR